MPTYTFKPLPASSPVTVYAYAGGTRGAQAATGTTDASGAFSASLAVGDYIADVTFGYYRRSAAGELAVKGDPEAAVFAPASATAPSNPQVGDLWLDTSGG